MEMDMDILKIMSIEGFAAYYKEYLAKIKEVNKRYRLYRKMHGGNSRNADCRKVMEEHTELVDEMHSIARKYAKLCSFQELKDAIDEYPEGTDMYGGLKIILDEKNKMMKTMNTVLDYLGI